MVAFSRDAGPGESSYLLFYRPTVSLQSCPILLLLEAGYLLIVFGSG